MSVKTQYQNLLHRLEMNALEWVGLDIGSASIKMIKGKWSGRQFTATGACIMELEEVESSRQQEQMIQVIHRCLQKAEMKNHYAVCAHSGPEVVTRHFQFPPLPDEALGQAIQLEAQQMSPFDVGQSIVEYQAIDAPGKGAENGRRGFLVVAMRDAVTRKVEWVKAAGGKIVLMDVEGLAALNCLTHCLPRDADGSMALIHIGNRFTTVTIVGENGIPFIRDLTYAGKNILTAVQQQTESNAGEVRRVLFNTEEKAPVPPKIQAALKNASTRSIADINETLRYYLTQNPGSELKRICLTGGWALSRPFVELLVQALPVKVEVFNPFDTIPIKAPIPQEVLMKQSGPALTVAVGLAMRTIS